MQHVKTLNRPGAQTRPGLVTQEPVTVSDGQSEACVAFSISSFSGPNG